MKILTISGWGQDPEIISKYLNEPSEYLDYHQYEFSELKEKVDSEYDVIIGWSLGGQIALNLLNYINAKKIILIATPYQFIDKKYGVKQKDFDGFVTELKSDKNKLLTKFKQLIAFQDSNFKQVINSLPDHDFKTEHLLYWLNYLKDFRYNNQLNIEASLIYGKKDILVNYQQADQFAQHLPNSKISIVEDASHAPFFLNQVI